jgi:hypothetical protein
MIILTIAIFAMGLQRATLRATAFQKLVTQRIANDVSEEGSWPQKAK